MTAYALGGMNATQWRRLGGLRRPMAVAQSVRLGLRRASMG